MQLKKNPSLVEQKKSEFLDFEVRDLDNLHIKKFKIKAQIWVPNSTTNDSVRFIQKDNLL